MAQHWICQTCGTQFSASGQPPEDCPICLDERQYVHQDGQSWTMLEQLIAADFQNEFEQEEPHVISITTKPGFAIGQSAYLIQTPAGNVLWDCITYLDEETTQRIEALGGLRAIAISHPHYYTTHVEWAEQFQVPVYLHEDDRRWVMRESESVHFWSGEFLPILEGLTLYRLGGHFKGATVLHWNGDAEGKGVLFTGDTIQVVPDTNWVSFMYSYPNQIPLPAAKVKQIAEKVKPLAFEKIYGAFRRQVKQNASDVVQKSAERYIRALDDSLADRL